MPYHPPGYGAEAQSFLQNNPTIEAIEMVWTDLSGVTRGKLLRREELYSAFERGRFFPISVMVLDQTGQDVPETQLVFDEGDRDIVAWPVPGSLGLAPWSEGKHGRYLATLHDFDGTPLPLDPRHLLKGVVDQFLQQGHIPVCAIELEFFLFDQHSALKKKPRPPKGLRVPERLCHYQPYDLQGLSDFSPFFEDVYRFCAMMGLPAQALISEYAPGQMEITLKHQADALQAADDAVAFKRVIKAAAERHGLLASFMAKPYAEWSGSGMHLHVSLLDQNRTPLFATSQPCHHPPLLHGIGGLKDAMAESMLIFAPNPNSYRRLRSHSYAPTTVTWGVNNRTVSLRIPAGDPTSCHIEHRVSGADANPYLALTAVLAGLHHGLTHRLDPGPPVQGNGYHKEDNGGPKLPTNIYAALNLFEKAQILPLYFGTSFMKIFKILKETEVDRFYAVPTERDFEWYLRTV